MTVVITSDYHWILHLRRTVENMAALYGEQSIQYRLALQEHNDFINFFNNN
jgi:hypothetical protein